MAAERTAERTRLGRAPLAMVVKRTAEIDSVWAKHASPLQKMGLAILAMAFILTEEAEISDGELNKPGCGGSIKAAG